VKRSFLGTVLALLLAPAVAHAAGDTTFQTVDEVTHDTNNSRLIISGIVDGESSARSVAFFVWHDTTNDLIWNSLLESCERNAVLSMNRPGRYRLTVTLGSSNRVVACTLKRNQ